MNRNQKRLVVAALPVLLCATTARGRLAAAAVQRPDELARLVAASLITSPTYPIPGERVEVAIGVRNDGAVAARRVAVALLADGQPVGVGQVDVAQGATATLHLPWTPAEERVYILTVNVDPARAVPEEDRADDSRTAAVVVAHRPPATDDLAIAALDLVTRPDGAVFLRIAVANAGSAAARGPLEVRTGGQLITALLVPSVAAGASSTLEVQLPSGIDPDQLSAELNPRFRATLRHPAAALRVREARAARDLRVEGLSIAATPPESGRTRRVTINFRVVNHGSQPLAAPLRTRISPGSVAADRSALEPSVVTSAGLAPGQAIYVARTLTLPEAVHVLDVSVETDIDSAGAAPPGSRRVATAHFQNPLAEPDRWVSMGPRHLNEGLGAVGVLFSIAADPSGPTLYVGSHGSGVWRSNDAGLSWSPITDALPTLKIAALALDPSRPNRVYVATPDFGIFRSDDEGTSWAQVSGAAPPPLTDCCDTLIVDPTNPDTLYITSTSGVYQSIDAGATWTQSLGGAQATSLVLDRSAPSFPGKLWAALLKTGLAGPAIYGRPLGGAAWTQVTGCPSGGLPPADDQTKITLALAGSILYAGFRTPTTFALARTTGKLCTQGQQASAEWELRWNPTGQMIGDQTIPAVLWNGIYADPIDPRFVYATGTFFWASTDGGATFTVHGEPHSDDHGFAAAPGSLGTIYLVCDGGIYRSTDHGRDGTWQSLGDGISNMEFYDIALAPSDPSFVIGGTQDNGTQRYDGTSTAWAWIKDGDGATVAIDPKDTKILYGMQQYATSIARTTNGGSAWQGIGAGLPAGAVCMAMPFRLHPVHPSTILASCGSLWRTVAPGSEWLAILVPPAGDAVVDVAIDPKTDLYYAGTSAGRIFAAPGGGGWQQVFLHPAGKGITALAVDPDDLATLYAAFGGVGGSRVYRLRRDAPIPQTLAAQDITADLPPLLVVRTVAVDRMVAWTIYAGTNAGVFRGRSSDDGASWHWESYGAGMAPGVDVRRLEVHPTTGVLRAGTFGRSAYEVNTDFPIGSLGVAEGQITLLRAHDVGTGYGPPTDALDVEAVVWLDTQPGKAFGFQLRTGSDETDHRGMLALLRDAFANGRPVRIDYLRIGLRNAQIVRVAELP